MNLRLFSDLIDAIGNVAGGLKVMIKLPKALRETMGQTLDETYRLIDTTLNMVTIWLGDFLRRAADTDFLREAARPDNNWTQAERDFWRPATIRRAPWV